MGHLHNCFWTSLMISQYEIDCQAMAGKALAGKGPLIGTRLYNSAGEYAFAANINL
jgi:hypothetical protein